MFPWAPCPDPRSPAQELHQCPLRLQALSETARIKFQDHYSNNEIQILGELTRTPEEC